MSWNQIGQLPEPFAGLPWAQIAGGMVLAAVALAVTWWRAAGREVKARRELDDLARQVRALARSGAAGTAIEGERHPDVRDIEKSLAEWRQRANVVSTDGWMLDALRRAMRSMDGPDATGPRDRSAIFDQVSRAYEAGLAARERGTDIKAALAGAAPDPTTPTGDPIQEREADLGAALGIATLRFAGAALPPFATSPIPPARPAPEPAAPTPAPAAPATSRGVDPFAGGEEALRAALVPGSGLEDPVARVLALREFLDGIGRVRADPGIDLGAPDLPRLIQYHGSVIDMALRADLLVRAYAEPADLPGDLAAALALAASDVTRLLATNGIVARDPELLRPVPIRDLSTEEVLSGPQRPLGEWPSLRARVLAMSRIVPAGQGITFRIDCMRFALYQTGQGVVRSGRVVVFDPRHWN